MVKYCLLKTDSQDLAEEIVQESFLKLWEKKHTSIQQPESYLFIIVRNTLANHFRKQIPPSSSPIEEANFIASPVTEKENLLPTKMLDKAIEELPEKCKNIVLMSYYEGLTKNEIAQYLGISIETVKKQRKIGLNKLRQKLIPA